MAGDNVLNITKDNFDAEVMASDLPVLVDFWAPWCGPCRMVGPIVDELADELKGKVKVAKINVDEQGDLAAKFRVMNIPTILLLKGGKIVDKAIGAQPKASLLTMINKHS
ncbi:MAG: thioredoxin [Christensenellales bacterium]|jgi:thioredoxin 1